MRQILENLYSKVLPVKEDFGHKKQMRVDATSCIISQYYATCYPIIIGKYPE